MRRDTTDEDFYKIFKKRTKISLLKSVITPEKIQLLRIKK